MKGIINRIKGAYTLLTSRRWVVMTYNSPQSGVIAYFNVTHDGFRALVEVVDAGYEQLEAQDSIVEQAKEILN